MSDILRPSSQILRFKNHLEGTSPETAFPGFHEEVLDYAAGLTGPSTSHSGLLYLIATDEEWAAERLNQFVGPDGATAVHERPPEIPIRPEAPANNGAAIAIFNAALKEYDMVQANSKVLKQVIIDNMGPTIAQTIVSEHRGIRYCSCRELVDYLKARFSGAHDRIIAHFMAAASAPAAPGDDLNSVFAHKQEAFRRLHDLGASLNDYEQRKALEQSLGTRPELAAAFTTFSLVHPTPVTQTLANLMVHLRAQARPSNIYNPPFAANVQAAPITQADLQQAVSAAVGLALAAHGGSRGPFGGRRTNVSGGQAQRGFTQPANKYCYFHGYDRGHSSADCSMLAEPHLEHKRKATAHKAVPRGVPPGNDSTRETRTRTPAPTIAGGTSSA